MLSRVVSFFADFYGSTHGLQLQNTIPRIPKMSLKILTRALRAMEDQTNVEHHRKQVQEQIEKMLQAEGARAKYTDVVSEAVIPVEHQPSRGHPRRSCCRSHECTCRSRSPSPPHCENQHRREFRNGLPYYFDMPPPTCTDFNGGFACVDRPWLVTSNTSTTFGERPVVVCGPQYCTTALQPVVATTQQTVAYGPPRLPQIHDSLGYLSNPMW